MPREKTDVAVLVRETRGFDKHLTLRSDAVTVGVLGVLGGVGLVLGIFGDEMSSQVRVSGILLLLMLGSLVLFAGWRDMTRLGR